MAIAERFQRLLPRNRFARSVSILAGGTAAGQVIVVLASPLLTRLYSPEDFGLLAVYAALLGIIGVIASLRYQLAIPLAESDEEAAHVVVLGLLVVLGMTVLTTLAVVLFREPIATALNTPALAGYLWLLPVGLLLTGIYEVFNYWAIRVKAFPAIARTRLTQALSTVVVQLGGYMLGPLALLLGQISGQAAGGVASGPYLQFITSPLSLLFPVLEKQNHEVLFQSALLVSRLVALLVGAWYGDLMMAVILFSLSSAGCYLGVLIWEIQVSGNNRSVIYSSSLRALVISGLAVSPLTVAQLLELTIGYWVGALVLTGLFVASRYAYLGRTAW